MAITLRNTKGSALTHAELDANFTTLQDKVREVVSFNDFLSEAQRTDAASGTATIDMTAAMQAALDSGATLVRGVSGHEYLVTQAGTKTLAGTVNYFCLDIPSGVTVDLNGATVKRADASNAIIFINQNAGTSQDTDIGFTTANGYLDGNEANQTAPATGEMPMLMLWDVLRPRVWDVKAKNARDYFGRFLTIEQGYFNNLHGVRSDGDGWSFGVSGTRNVVNSFVDNIYAEDCTNGVYGSLQGNGFICTMNYCNVGKVTTKNCGGGIKIQGPASDNIFGQLIFQGGANDTLNSGIKIQGQTGLQDVNRITVGQILSNDSQGTGFQVTECINIGIGAVTSYGDGAAGSTAAVRIDSTSTDIDVGRLHIENPGASGLDHRSTNTTYGSVTVKNAGQVAISNRYGVNISAVADGLSIASLLLIDEQATKTTDRMLNIVSGATDVRVDTMRVRGDTVVAGAFIVDSTAQATILNRVIDGVTLYKPLVSTTQTGNIGAGEDDLCTVTIPARPFYKDGQGFKITAWGLVANNANAKTVKLLFGGQTICTTAMTVNEVSFWRVEATILRSSVGNQAYNAHMTKGATTFITDIERGSLTVSEASDIIVKLTGTATSDNDVVCYSLLVEPI